MDEDVLNFINAIKSKYPQQIEDTFSNGYCYWFAKILELRFGGVIYFNPIKVHFGTLIGNKIFDINGIISDGDEWFLWDDYQYIEDTDMITNTCILKNT